MIIEYDTRPDATVDEKLRSLIQSIQLALGEVGIDASNANTSQTQDLSAVIAELRRVTEDITSLSDAISGIADRVTALENAQVIPEAPAEDGAYVLTVTVEDEEATYTWEAAGEGE